jgi:hypothetical protein
MIKAKGLHLVITLLIIFTMFIPINTARAQSSPAEDQAGGPRKRVELTLRADGAPLPGGTAQLSIEATPLVNTPDLEIQWVIPQGVQLLGAEVDTFSNISVNQTVHTERSLSFPTAGTYKIAVSVSLRLAPEVTFGTSGVLFFIIDPHGSRVTDMDPDAHRPVSSGLEQVTVSSTPAGISPQAPNSDPCFTITGHVDRIDRPQTSTGYGPSVTIPLAGFRVEIRESDILFDDSYGRVTTDSNGDFTKSFCDDDGWFDDTLEIYVRLATERGDPKVYVEDSSWIDEEYEYNTGEVSSGGGTINFNLNLDNTWSGMFNIVEAAYLARQLWVNSGDSYGEETEIHWENGYGDDGSYFDPFWNEITIADDPSDPDQWDDSVIMHEWGHSADDYYSCDDNPGGDHYIDALVDDPELAWGEGYPDYYQSAVRNANSYPEASWYFDMNGAGTGGIMVNLENYDLKPANLISTRNELAIAAALWDFNDNVNDRQDTVNHGHAMVQDVYTSNAFFDVAYGFWDDTCDFDTYMRGWVDAGKPADGPTAAAVLQNTGYTLSASSLVEGSPTSINAASSPGAADIYRWWNQLTYVADNSASMAGPKFDAMKTLFTEAVNDLGNDPLGTEFTLDLFNNSSSTNTTEFAGQFFPSNLITPINGLSTIGDADPNCQVSALQALSQAVDDKEKGDVWLFTDGDTVQSPSVENTRQLLNENRMRASVALMGVCPPKTENTVPLGPVSTETLQSLTPDEQQSLMAERLLPGKARAALGPMAADVPGGLVPYLLTALNSGGQFLYVDSSQVTDAANILRAQITNSAGAGRWSDYVSNVPTYRYDTLASYEYNWIDAFATGENMGNPAYNSYLDITLPSPFTYYGNGPYSTVQVYQDGYVTFDYYVAYVPGNDTLPNLSWPNNALYPFWDDLTPYYIICASSPSSPDCGDVGYIYTQQQGDWFAIEYYQYYFYVTDFTINTFEILFNLATGEIRYQYQTVPGGAPSATIGLENSSGTNGVQVSYNDVGGASNSMGYKFTPVPAQPTKTYTVTVDSSMDSVGFLLSGYSGSFEPLAVTDPDGNLVNCAEPGALCLNLDLVQYVQVNTNGRNGDWKAVVAAGATGEGTFSFTSLAASPIAVESAFDHTLSTTTQQLLVRLSGQVDGSVLTGRFQSMNGSPFGDSFSLFDDGLHGDKHAGDGLFGSDPFSSPGAGSAYLALQGLNRGEPFVRIDPVPYTFQPLQVISLGDGVNFGGVTPLQFQFTNYDAFNHWYYITYEAPAGWWIDLSPFFPYVYVGAGQTYVATYNAYLELYPSTTNDLPSGTTGVVTLSATELEKGEISDSASARITRHREPYAINIFNTTHFLRPNGDTAPLEFFVVDAQNVLVADGTQVQLGVSTGVISPTIGTTVGGTFRATFTSGADLGTALITATTLVGVNGMTAASATTNIEIGNPKPNQIALATSATQLPADGISTATLVATVRDRWDNPVPNQTVRIGVEGDGQVGTISGGEVVTGTTDVNGQFSAVLTSGKVVAVVGVRAELLYDKGGGLEVVHDDRKEILVGTRVYLPLLNR